MSRLFRYIPFVVLTIVAVSALIVSFITSNAYHSALLIIMVGFFAFITLRDLPLAPNLVDELRIKILDKMVVGVIAVILLFFGNKALETHREDQAFRSRLMKQRIEIIAEAWRLYNKSEERAYSAIKVLAAPPASDVHNIDEYKRSLQPRMDELLPELDKSVEIAYKYMNANRFWLGSKEYQRLHAQYLTLRDLTQAVVDRDQNMINKLQQQRKKSMWTVQETLSRF